MHETEIDSYMKQMYKFVFFHDTKKLRIFIFWGIFIKCTDIEFFLVIDKHYVLIALSETSMTSQTR